MSIKANDHDAAQSCDDAEQRWLRYPALAAKIGVSERTVRRDVNDGKLPKPIKVRGCVLFDWLAVAAALKQRQQV
jgi:predicted DNA-binding transcriptional regulator AlpA